MMRSKAMGCLLLMAMSGTATAQPPQMSDDTILPIAKSSRLPFVALTGGGVSASGESAAEQPTGAFAVRSPDLWYVDITMMGTQCIVDPANIRLWRPDADKPAKLRIFGPANAPSAIVDFAAGATVASVDPAAFPIVDGSSMTIADAASGATIGQIDFAILPSQPDNASSLAEAMKARGCMAQLELVPNLRAHG
jgi:hypothetical protein